MSTMLGPVIGVVHLDPLPSAPRFGGDLEAVVHEAVGDAAALAEAGFDAVIVENFGDAPFYADDVPKVTVAAMARIVAAVVRRVDVPVGVNVLRNDAEAALAVAAASGAEFIRVNVLTGTMWTDQGLIEGRAAEVLRLRDQLAPSVRVLADVFVKHATPPPGASFDDAVADTVQRGLADGIIVTGSATGGATDLALLAHAAQLTDVPVFAGSGVTTESISATLGVASGVIIGSAAQVDGGPGRRVDPKRAAALVAAAT